MYMYMYLTLYSATPRCVVILSMTSVSLCPFSFERSELRLYWKGESGVGRGGKVMRLTPHLLCTLTLTIPLE